MPKIERLSESIAWIDLSFVERQRTPEWAIQLGIRQMIRLHGQEFWLYGAVDPETNEILHVSLFPTTTKQTTRWFLTDLHRRYQLDDVVFLVDDADYLGPVLAEDGYRFRILPHGNRNAIERTF